MFKFSVRRTMTIYYYSLVRITHVHSWHIVDFEKTAYSIVYMSLHVHFIFIKHLCIHLTSQSYNQSISQVLFCTCIKCTIMNTFINKANSMRMN